MTKKPPELIALAAWLATNAIPPHPFRYIMCFWEGEFLEIWGKSDPSKPELSQLTKVNLENGQYAFDSVWERTPKYVSLSDPTAFDRVNKLLAHYAKARIKKVLVEKSE